MTRWVSCAARRDPPCGLRQGAKRSFARRCPRLLSAVFALLTACGTHRAHAPDAAPFESPIELRAAHGELVLQLARRGKTGWDVLRPDGPTLHVETRADAIVVSEGDAVLLDLRAGPNGFTGKDLRIVFPAERGFVRVIDGIGVTSFSADPAPGGGTFGRDASGTPTLEAHAERDRIVVDRPHGGERLATVHHLGDAPEATLCAALLGTDSLPVQARAAAAAYVLSR
jgi:hypothetical protein